MERISFVLKNLSGWTLNKGNVMDSEFRTMAKFFGCIAAGIGALIIGFMLIYPQYNVYSQRMEGEAQLAHAEYSKRIAVETAKAKRDAAAMEADAEVARAEGVAKANKIIGESLHDNPEYLKYLWLTNIDHNTDKTVIYIPTEGNIPLLETSRLQK